MMYEQRTEVIFAVQWKGDNLRDVQDLMFPLSPLARPGTPHLGIYVDVALVFADPSDYIVKLGTTFIVVKEEQFEQLYQQIGVPDGTVVTGG